MDLVFVETVACRIDFAHWASPLKPGMHWENSQIFSLEFVAVWLQFL